MHDYLFKSNRLGFRNWKDSDLDEFAKINADKEVMQFFPRVLTEDESLGFLQKSKQHYNDKGYAYFAIEVLKTNEFIGFIGIEQEVYDNEFYPAINMSWRLKRSAWGNGYATEGAKECISYAFLKLGIKRIIACCTINNRNSEKIMQKLGMIKVGEFLEPRLEDVCNKGKVLCYEIVK